MSLVYRLIGGMVAVWLTVLLGHHLGLGLKMNGPLNELIFIVVLAIANAVIRPIVKLFAWPLTCLTFGLFAFVVNALLFWGVAAVTKGIQVNGFLAALFGSVVLSILSGIINSFIKRSKNKD